MPRDDRNLMTGEDEMEMEEPRPRRRAIRMEPPPDDLDARAGDLDQDDAEQQFLRTPKRPPVRKGVNKKTANRLKWVVIGLAIFTVLGGSALWIYSYGTTSWRFQIESSDNIEIQGIQNVARAQVMEPFGGDIGRNIFFVPLDERKKQLEEIPWVESATVMRLLPDRLRIQIKERVPTAFAQIGSKVQLVDANGVVMDLPARALKKYSFPVIIGFGEAEPISTRSARMRIYSRLVQELDSEGVEHSKGISEVDLSDPDDVKVTVADPNGAVLVHLGPSNFLERYKFFQAHVASWREQFTKLQSVDLRYDGQIIVNPDHSAKPTVLEPKEQ